MHICSWPLVALSSDLQANVDLCVLDLHTYIHTTYVGTCAHTYACTYVQAYLCTYVQMVYVSEKTTYSSDLDVFNNLCIRVPYRKSPAMLVLRKS